MKKIVLVLTVLLISSLVFAFEQTGKAELSWTMSSSDTVTKYKIFQSNVSGEYDFTSPAGIIGHPTDHLLLNLSLDLSKTYFWVICAVDAEGLMSPASNEASKSWVIPEAPTDVKVTITIIIVNN